MGMNLMLSRPLLKLGPLKWSAVAATAFVSVLILNLLLRTVVTVGNIRKEPSVSSDWPYTMQTDRSLEGVGGHRDGRSLAPNKEATCAQPTRAEDVDGGDCQAFNGPRRPTWACPHIMKEALTTFQKIYQQRPIQDNQGGMMFDHSFALWYTVHTLQPSFVIESGARAGQSTWMIRQAAPNCKIFSLDPRRPDFRLENVEYLNDGAFKDFARVDWSQKGVDKEKTLILFDDHQSGFRRVQEAISLGFRFFVFDDNYEYNLGDNMSPKWVCERARKDVWPGKVPDNFAKTYLSKSWEEHLQDGEILSKQIKTYYEFPPVLASNLTGQNRFDPLHASVALINTEEEMDQYGMRAFMRGGELKTYTHFGFLVAKELVE